MKIKFQFSFCLNDVNVDLAERKVLLGWHLRLLSNKNFKLDFHLKYSMQIMFQYNFIEKIQNFNTCQNESELFLIFGISKTYGISKTIRNILFIKIQSDK